MSKTNYVNPFRMNALISFPFHFDGDSGVFKTRDLKAAQHRESTMLLPNKSSLLHSTAQLGLSCVLRLVVAALPCWKVSVVSPLCSNPEPGKELMLPTLWLSCLAIISDLS